MAFSPQAAFEFLQRAQTAGRLAHAYLITGPTGSGKRDLASRLGWFLHRGEAAMPSPDAGLKLPDLHTIEPESKSRLIRVEQTRELEKSLQMRSSIGGRKIGVILDADRMNAAASNSFLKTLEEPPSNSLLLLLTAHPEMLLDTILSRCILVPLMAPKTVEPTGPERQLLEVLSRFFEKPQAELGEVFLLVREFNLLLSASRQMSAELGESELKKEEALYKQTTDGKWLADRSDYFKALGESRYLQARAALVDRLLQWWGDVLRQQHGAASLDFPDYTTQTGQLASRFSTPEVLRRVEALEGLRENFNRNVQEQLAVEVAFLKAFGGS
ncbi:MAG TPA: hypothetical protein VNQ90_12045 [Chthoniobacteraceae bacterium]|nr:hypothetical protein [Chthoniobacteraceae bacterium]